MTAIGHSRKQPDTADFERDGFEIFPNLIGKSECDEIAEVLTGALSVERGKSKTRIGGVRNLLSTQPVVLKIATDQRILSAVQRGAPEKMSPVRAIFFDKTPDANWGVPWHQDLSVAVVDRIDTAGFEGWSVKDGVLHVQPPAEILNRMVTLRIHLDDCTAENGALRVIPGSHRHGKMKAEMISQWTDKDAVTCEVLKGGAVRMRPLILHSSPPSQVPNHRRVLHLEYASDKLPGGLRWFEEASDEA